MPNPSSTLYPADDLYPFPGVTSVETVATSSATVSPSLTVTSPNASLSLAAEVSSSETLTAEAGQELVLSPEEETVFA